MANSEGKIDYSHMVCGECGLKMVYRSSPSNLLQHLSGAHLISALKSSESSSTTKISSFFNRSKASQIKKYKRDHPTQKKFKDKVVKWIVKRKRPFSIVEDPEFIDMVNFLDPKIEVIKKVFSNPGKCCTKYNSYPIKWCLS